MISKSYTPVTIEFELLNTKETDIQCMDVFVKCLEIMDSASNSDRMAAFKWMKEILDSAIENTI